MDREPQTYAIWSAILRGPGGKFLVTIKATSFDHPTHDASFAERAEFDDLKTAKQKQVELVRELARRLRAQGNIVFDVTIAPHPYNDPD